MYPVQYFVCGISYGAKDMVSNSLVLPVNATDMPVMTFTLILFCVDSVCVLCLQ